LAGSAFKNADVVKALSAFTPVLVDGDTEKDMTKKYGVHGYPTVVFADAQGAEIDRIVGYREAAQYLAEIERIKSGKGTLDALRRKVAESPDDLDAALALGAKLSGGNAEEAAGVFAGLLEKTKDMDKATQARIHLEYAAALSGSGKSAEAMTEAEKIVKDFADTPSAGQVVGRVGNAFLRAEVKRALAFLDAARELAKENEDKAAVEKLTVVVLKNGIAASLKRQAAAAGDDPQALNEVAWSCFEQKLNVREALGWAKKAAEKSDRDPAILDTLANLMNLMGQRAEAIKVEEEAASKATGPMKKEFESNVAKWKAELEEMKASGAIPATPLVPSPAK
jgi:tetratricopeptide (TPR) repeat protein